MAFYYKEKSDECSVWINNNQNLYDDTIDKNKPILELGGLLHIYGVFVDNMPDKSLFVKYEDYKKYVKWYHKLIHSIIGVRILLSWSDSPFRFFSSQEDVISFCLSWVIHGDFYESLVYQIIECYSYEQYKKRQQELKALKNRFIYESIYLGIKTLDDWKRYHTDMNEIKGWTVLSDDFEPPILAKSEEESAVLPVAIHDNEKEKRNSTPCDNLNEKESFSNMLKCDADIKDEVIKALANEIISNNSSDRIANIRFALERKKWIDSEISFLPFYIAFDLAIKPFTEEGFHLISRNKGSKVYHNNPTLLLHEQKGQLNKEEEQRLFEVERICKLLDDLKSNAEKAIETEGS